jgi:hypothetical protein
MFVSFLTLTNCTSNYKFNTSRRKMLRRPEFYYYRLRTEQLCTRSCLSKTPREYDFSTFIEIRKIKMSIPNYYERLYAFSHIITMLRFRMSISLLCDHDYYYDSPTQRNKFVDKIKYKQY